MENNGDACESTWEKAQQHWRSTRPRVTVSRVFLSAFAVIGFCFVVTWKSRPEEGVSEVLEEEDVFWLPLHAEKGKGMPHDGFFLQSPTHQTALHNFGNTVYYAGITLGTPPKSFKAVFDTGSEITWVPDKICRDAACQNHHGFLVHDSSTGKVLGVTKEANGEERVKMGAIQYGSGAMMGVFASDIVRVAGVSVKMAFLVATHEQNSAFANAPFDGLFGVGRVNAKYNDKPLSFMDAAMQQGKIKKNIISFFLPTRPGGRGTVVVGGTSRSLYTGKLRWHPAMKFKLPMWAPELKSLQVGNGANLCTKGCIALVDTGTSLLITGGRIAQSVNAQLRIPADCKRLNSGPSVHFTFGDQHKYSLPAHAVTLEAETPRGTMCSPAIRAMAGRRPPGASAVADVVDPAAAAAGAEFEEVAAPHAARRLMGGGKPPSGAHNKWGHIKSMFGDRDVVILGDVFLRHHYSAFDNSDPSNPKVGLATAAAASSVPQFMETGMEKVHA